MYCDKVESTHTGDPRLSQLVGIHAQSDLSPITQTPDLLGLRVYSDQPAQSLSTDGLTEAYATSNISSSSSCAIAGRAAPDGSAVLGIDRKQREMGGATPRITRRPPLNQR